MSVHVREEQRHVLPRWRESGVAATTSEVSALPVDAAPLPRIDVSEVNARVADWRARPSVGTAADAVSVGFVHGVADLVREPAAYLLSRSAELPLPVRQLVSRLLDVDRGDVGDATEVTVVAQRGSIAALRQRLIATPHDPLGYVDLARRYAVLGQIEAAKHALRIALALAPHSRFVLRSANRFYVHAGDPERAQLLLVRAPRTRSDPWLMAAEIATATLVGRTSKLLKRGRDVIASAGIAPVHLSELAGAIGTLEAKEGNRRRARKLFLQAMTAPTDNSLAQAQWAFEALDLPALPSSDSVPRAFEASALALLRESRWEETVRASRAWLDDEPFSHKSAAFGSFVAATGLGDHAQAVSFARVGLVANPDDQTLRNNLVFSLASVGRLDDALLEAERVDTRQMDDHTKIAWTATVGLLNYHSKNATVGRSHYEQAISAAERLGKPGMAAAAALNWALVAAQLSDSAAEEILIRANVLAERAPGPVVDVLLRRVAVATQGRNLR